ncbi:hypothetical protein C0J52_10367 [Blattella germanica]|nr:hypothetical protein C0J52_10367 [Blattella germanica]
MALYHWISVVVLLVVHLISHSEGLKQDDTYLIHHVNESLINITRHMKPHHGIHVANWRWDEIGVFFTFTIFIVVSGLAKVAFHHASSISAHIPESCICGVPPPNKEDNNPQDHLAVPLFTPRLFFLVLLPPVVLEAAYSLYNRAFTYNVCTILLYAVVGTLFNTFTIGPLLFFLSWLGFIGSLPQSLSLTECLVFSSLISAVDPVAVLAIFQEIGVNKDLYYLVFGESLFNGVFLLTAGANKLRVRKINLQEQFIMAYGGLRGAIAFSMVEMLEEDTVPFRNMFVTTTLVVIFFTVFIQIVDSMMAGIEEISGVRGDFYIRIDELFLKKIFLSKSPDNDLTRFYEKLCLTDHYAHLYGPVTLVEESKALVINNPQNEEERSPLVSSPSTRTTTRFEDLFPGVELRRRTGSVRDSNKPVSTDTLRKALSTHDYQKFHQIYNPNLVDDHCQELRDQLRLRHLKARRIAGAASQLRRQISEIPGDVFLEEFDRPRRQIHSGLYRVRVILTPSHFSSHFKNNCDRSLD